MCAWYCSITEEQKATHMYTKAHNQALTWATAVMDSLACAVNVQATSLLANTGHRCAIMI